MTVHDREMLLACATLLTLIGWPILWLASISTHKLFFGPELAPVWRLRRRIMLTFVSFGVGAAAALSIASSTPTGLHLPTDDQFFRALFEHPSEFFSTVVMQLSRGVLIVMAVALVIKLYGKWIARRLSDAELKPGAEGFRAWLSPWNVLAALLLSVTAWLGYDCSFWSIATLAFGTLLAFPLVTTMTDSSNYPSAPAPTIAENLSPERERVLRLLEQGKVTGEEAAELLAALAATVTPQAVLPMPEPWTLTRKLSLVGACLVLLGFFLPWYSINPAREVAKLSQSMNEQMRQMVGNVPTISPIPNTDLVSLTPTSGDIRYAGGDMEHGLGWIALLLGLGTAAIPYVVTGVSRDARWKLSLVTGSAGAIIVLYLLTARPSVVSFGIPTVLIGFAIELFALYRERHPSVPSRAFPIVPAMA